MRRRMLNRAGESFTGRGRVATVPIKVNLRDDTSESGSCSLVNRGRPATVLAVRTDTVLNFRRKNGFLTPLL